MSTARLQRRDLIGCDGVSEDNRSVENLRMLGQRMAELLNGYQVSAAIGAVARLGVADCLSAGPAELNEVASRVGADARSLERVVRLLADVGIFEQLDDGRVALTALGGMLRDEVPGLARRAAIVVSEEWHWRAYGTSPTACGPASPGSAKLTAAASGSTWSVIPERAP